MNEINEFLEVKNDEVSSLTKHIKESVTRLQQAVDKTSSYIFQYMRDELEEIERLQDTHKIVVVPSIHFWGNGIAPTYDTDVHLRWHIFGLSKTPQDKLVLLATPLPILVKDTELEERLCAKRKDLERQGLDLSWIADRKLAELAAKTIRITS